MKVRESGMPDRNLWERFFDPRHILTTLGINSHTRDVADFGCGYGTFTIPAAQIIKGHVHALDIDSEMIRITKQQAQELGLTNVNAVVRDFMVEGSGLSDKSVDYVMLFNILHLKNPEILLTEARRILKAKGRLGVIHWNYDPSTPRGPSMDIRPKPQDCIKWAERAGFTDPKQHDLKPYHYGIVLTTGAQQDENRSDNFEQ